MMTEDVDECPVDLEPSKPSSSFSFNPKPKDPAMEDSNAILVGGTLIEDLNGKSPLVTILPNPSLLMQNHTYSKTITLTMIFSK